MRHRRGPDAARRSPTLLKTVLEHGDGAETPRDGATVLIEIVHEVREAEGVPGGSGVSVNSKQFSNVNTVSKLKKFNAFSPL